MAGSGASDAVASSRLGLVERVVGAREKCVEAFIRLQRRDARAPAVLLESSGGLSLENAATYAATGVDYLAVGALTHSVRALDIGLDM